MLVRAMEVGDAEAVALLCAQLGYPASAGDVRRRLERLAGDPDHALFVAAVPGSGVVGWVHVHGRRLLEAEPYAEIGGLVVDEEWRGRGIGRALMARAERWALDAGYAEVRVRSNTVRAGAHRFYLGLGYRLAKSQHVFAKAVPQSSDGEGDGNVPLCASTG